MDSLEGHKVYPRGQTAGAENRFNKMQQSGAWATRGNVHSQHNVNRNDYKNFNAYSGYGDDRVDTTTATSQNMVLSKSGFTHYPGQPLKISQESLLGQTLNKFELGEQEKHKMRQISGIEYYK